MKIAIFKRPLFKAFYCSNNLKPKIKTGHIIHNLRRLNVILLPSK